MSSLLQPLAWAYAAAGAARWQWTRGAKAALPVICVGNLVAGGAGKTPVVLSLAQLLSTQGCAAHIVSRGYGGSLAGPVAVDPRHHGARDVGDEALLLAEVAPTWVARDRAAAAERAASAGASLLLLDDGLQNPGLVKDLSLVVVDGQFGFGNGRVVPAGPLREPLGVGLARADAVVLIGDDEAGIVPVLAAKRVLRARLVAGNADAFRGRAVLAFAGIGRPAKFFRTIGAAGARVVAHRGFADHHLYREDELSRLQKEAVAAGATLVTTAKDWVRLSPEWRSHVEVLRVAVVWEDTTALDRLLAQVIRSS